MGAYLHDQPEAGRYLERLTHQGRGQRASGPYFTFPKYLPGPKIFKLAAPVARSGKGGPRARNRPANAPGEYRSASHVAVAVPGRNRGLDVFELLFSDLLHFRWHGNVSAL